MNSLLLVIDLQQYFINENTKEIPSKIEDIVNSGKYKNIAFTRFVNFKNSIYTKKLNWNGCINKNETQIVIDTKNNKIFNKSIYSAVNKELLNYIEENKIEEIYLCGIDTEACILKTAFDLFEKEYDVYVLKDYCASTLGVKRHNNAIAILKRNIGEKSII